MTTAKKLDLVSNLTQAEIFRQTRHENAAQDISIQIGKSAGVLKNWSRTGIGFEIRQSFEKFKVGQIIDGVVLSCDDITLYEGQIHIRSCREQDDTFFIGASFESGLFLVEGVESALSVKACERELESAATIEKGLVLEFCRSVLCLSSALRTIRKTCNAEERRWKKLPFDRRCEAEKIFLPNMAKRVKAALTRFNVEIAKQIDVEALPEGSIYHRIFNDEIYPYFAVSDMIRRAYEKPRGYAGDYEMMNQMYRDGFEGDDVFGRVLHHYTINEPSSESVKYRKPYFCGFYNSLIERPGTHKVLSIACGPAMELQEIVSAWDQSKLDRLQVTLFDLDREALEHAQTKVFDIAVRQGKRPMVTFINASVKSFLAQNVQSRESFDLIYSGGLFDYLDQVTSTALVRKFAAMLNPGGTLVIGNFTKDNYTKAFCHLLANWSLIHKTEDEIRAWADSVENCTVKIEYDPQRINAFLVVKKHGTD